MKRILLILTVVLVMAAMMVASVMPAFAQGQGPQGGNPGEGICKHNPGTAGESGRQSPSRLEGWSLRRALRTLQRVLYSPLQGLLSVPRTLRSAHKSRTTNKGRSPKIPALFLGSHLAQPGRELPRTPDRRSSQNTPSGHFGE